MVSRYPPSCHSDVLADLASQRPGIAAPPGEVTGNGHIQQTTSFVSQRITCAALAQVTAFVARHAYRGVADRQPPNLTRGPWPLIA